MSYELCEWHGCLEDARNSLTKDNLIERQTDGKRVDKVASPKNREHHSDIV